MRLKGLKLGFKLKRSIHSTIRPGLLIGRGKKSQMLPDFQDKFMERPADFTGFSQEFSGANFAKKQSVKIANFEGISCTNFVRN